MLVLSGIVVGASHAAHIELVFDNTTNPGVAVFGPGCCQAGNEVTLGGSRRKITQLSWMVDSQNNDVVVDFETRIYANDGPGGAPGTVIWESGLLTGINVLSTNSFVDILVPEVFVPNIVTFTSRIVASTPIALARVRGGPSSVGSLNASWFDSSVGGWSQQFGPWGLRVLAVPEPSVISLLAIAGILVLRSSRSRSRCKT